MAVPVQRATRHAVSRILFGLWRETLVGKVLDLARGSIVEPARISARALSNRGICMTRERNLAGYMQLIGNMADGKRSSVGRGCFSHRTKGGARSQHWEIFSDLAATWQGSLLASEEHDG